MAKNILHALLIVVGLAFAGAALAETQPLPRPATDGDYYPRRPGPVVELGRLLFFDKLLSGNKNIACATCHHPALASGDGVALPLGEGAVGLGPERRPGAGKARSMHGRVPRNSQPLFNLGAREYRRMFHDGRVEVDDKGYYDSGFISPAKWKLPRGLDNVLAAQAMFPVASSDEMAGQRGENDVANAVALNNVSGPGGAWAIIASRVAQTPGYVERFRAAFPGRVAGARDITMVEIANALAAFEAAAFRSDNSPFDAYLWDRRQRLPDAAMRGLALFYGRAGCASCHQGTFQTDHGFHSIAMPQIGPGKGDGGDASYWSGSGLKAYVEDFGRGRVTFRPEDNFKFRTPSLRNVAVTGPWGHDGAYATLEAVVRHHASPVASLHRYDPRQTSLPDLGVILQVTARGSRLGHTRLTASEMRGFGLRDFWVQTTDALRNRIARSNELAPVTLSETEVAELVAFLETLTDNQPTRVPTSVPSGLGVDPGPAQVQPDSFWSRLLVSSAGARANW